MPGTIRDREGLVDTQQQDRIVDALRQTLDDRGSDVDRLRREGLEVRTDASDDHMHHKFAVVDAMWLLNGSFNWTRSAGRNHENVHVTNTVGVVRPYQAEFDRLWATLDA